VTKFPAKIVIKSITRFAEFVEKLSLEPICRKQISIFVEKIYLFVKSVLVTNSNLAPVVTNLIIREI